jgi:hypothetical protein
MPNECQISKPQYLTFELMIRFEIDSLSVHHFVRNLGFNIERAFYGYHLSPGSTPQS